MTNFNKPVDALRYWFAERNINTDGLTIILNFTDPRAACNFDAALNADMSEYRINRLGEHLDIRKFQISGVSFQVESPVHHEKAWPR